MKRAFFVVILLAAAGVRAQTISATIDTGKIQPPINKYLYGQFVEHLRGTINNGLWAEMLDDRKFYNPITSAAATQAGRGRGGFQPARRWTPIGPDSAIVMDRASAFVGEHSPQIMLDASGPRGIQQGGLALRKDKSYAGRVLLMGDTKVTVTVCMVWGTGEKDRQSVVIENLVGSYEEFPLSFKPGVDSDAARIEIAGTGSGSFHIGAVSLMPTDNVKGFRPEVVALLAQLHSGVYRFPGGNYISNYQWQDTVGPIDKRPPTWDYAWNAIQPNDVGIDEFMQLWQLLGVDPYFTLNAGFGDAYSAAQLVEYCNGDASTPMGKWRAANGHAEPYGIKLWGIGNEMYGDWQLGVMPLSQFEKKHKIFAAAMKRVDPTITLVASGAMPDEMTVTLQGKRIDGNALTGILSKADWTGGLLSTCLPDIDMVSEHAYCTSNQGFDVASGKYVDVNETLQEWVRRPANRAKAKYEAYQEYLKQIPGLAAKRVPISLDEYSYRNIMPTSYKPAMAYAFQFDELFRHTDVFQMAAFTFATSCLSANRTDAVFNPVGLVFKLYRDNFGALPVEVSGNAPQPAPRYPVGGDQPKVNAGSDTFPLDVCAALSDDRKTLSIAVINPTEKVQQLAIAIKGSELAGGGHLWRMAPASVNAANLVGQPPQVVIEDQAVDSGADALPLPPISITIYQFPVK